MKKTVLIIIASLCLISCKKWNLERDNPLDGKNNANMQDNVSLKFDSYSVAYDNNNDGIVNKGETIYLFVNLKNNGVSVANAVKATFSTTSSYISGFSPTTQVDYGNISTGRTQSYGFGQTNYTPNYGYYTIKFTVSNSTPKGAKIPINISITDENSNTWTSSFEVTVEGIDANVGYHSHSVVYDNNNDDIINKGETVYLFVNLKNNGSSATNAVKATFSKTSSYVSGFSPTTQINYVNIFAGRTQDYGSGQTNYTPNYDYYTIKFTVSNSTPKGAKIPINIKITDESGNTWTSSFEVTVEGTSANIGYHSHSVVYDNNNDDIINKGETVYLFVNLKNNGSSTANAIKATFSTTSSYVSGFSPTTQVNYGNILSGRTQDYGSGQTSYTPNYDYYTIKFTVSNTTPNNTQIPISINMVDESNNTWTSSFNVTVQN